MAVPPLLRATLLIGGLAIAPRIVAAADCAVSRPGDRVVARALSPDHASAAARCRCSPKPRIGDSASAPAMARAYGVAVRARVLPGRHSNERRLQVLERFVGPARDTLWLSQHDIMIRIRRHAAAGQGPDSVVPQPAPQTVPPAAPSAIQSPPRSGARPNPEVSARVQLAPIPVRARAVPDSTPISSCDARLPAEHSEVLVLAREVSPGVLGVWQCSGLMVPSDSADGMLRGLRAAAVQPAGTRPML